MVGPIDKWEEIDYVYDMDLLASSLAAQLGLSLNVRI